MTVIEFRQEEPMKSTQRDTNVLVRFWPIWLSKLAWGMFWATWGATVPAVQLRLGLSDAQLGEQLVMVIVGVLPATFFAGRLWSLLGKFQLPLTLLIYSAGTMLLAHARSANGLGSALLVCGLASGMMEVTLACMIASAQELTGRKLFSYGQAIFPLAVVLTAPTVGWLRTSGVDAVPIFEALAAFLSAAAILTSLTSLRFPHGRRAGETAGHHAIRIDRPLVLITAMGFFLYILEHAINHWSALFLQRDLGASAFLASWGPSVYMGAAFVGRMTVHRLAARVSDLQVIMLGFFVAAVVMLWVSVVDNPWLALAAYLVAGLMMSPAIPAVYSLATAIGDPGRRMQSLANISTVCNIGYLVSPLFFGMFSSAHGMPFSWRAMSVAAAACLIVLIAAQTSGMFRHRIAAALLKQAR
jgi:MFS family permease